MDSFPRSESPVATVSDARLASVLNTAVDGILVIDERGTILVYNKACEGLFGYSPDEALGSNVRLIMPSDYADEHDQYLENYRETGHRKIIGIGREVRARHKDGTEFPVELSVGEARTPDGRQFIGIIRDLRSRKEAERRFRVNNRSGTPPKRAGSARVPSLLRNNSLNARSTIGTGNPAPGTVAERPLNQT